MNNEVQLNISLGVPMTSWSDRGGLVGWTAADYRLLSMPLGIRRPHWLSNRGALLSWGKVGGQSTLCWTETVSLRRISNPARLGALITSLPHVSGIASNFSVFMLKSNDFVIIDILQYFNFDF